MSAAKPNRLQHVSLGFVALLLNPTYILTIVFAWALLAEPVSLAQLAGAALVVTGVLLVSRRKNCRLCRLLTRLLVFKAASKLKKVHVPIACCVAIRRMLALSAAKPNRLQHVSLGFVALLLNPTYILGGA